MRTRQAGPVLLDGVNHVALVTTDTDRLHAFYRDIFDASVSYDFSPGPGLRLSMIDVGPFTELNVFEIEDGDTSTHDLPMFRRGRLDHMGLQAASMEAFTEIRRRLMERGVADAFVTDFGPVLSVFFVDPDGLEGEVCVPNPDAVPGVHNPPGTPATRFVDMP